MTERIEEFVLRVDGVAVPQGSKNAYVIGRRAVIVDANAPKLKPWRLKVHNAAVAELAGREGFARGIPLYCSLQFFLPRPRTAKRHYPSVKPDLDKTTRAVWDALTTAGVWADDCQVTRANMSKSYADDEPFVHITVRSAA
jgi:Holliday junction resolvase RusA-like endonuclease